MNSNLDRNDQNNAPSGSGLQNPFSNIGTPSFSISQIPAQILQNLTSAQIQMIQQRHQHILMTRMQQQQQKQDQQPGQVQSSQQGATGKGISAQKNPPVAAQSPNQSQSQAQAQAQPQAQARVQIQAQARAQAHTQARARAQGHPQRQMPPSQGMMQQSFHVQQPSPGQPPAQRQRQRQQQQNEFKASSGLNKAKVERQGGSANQQTNFQSQPVRNVAGSPASTNLPLQIAQLPLPMQQQVLNTLKQQAIAKNNPAMVTAITMAQQQLQQQLQQQQQQQQVQQQPQQADQQQRNQLQQLRQMQQRQTQELQVNSSFQPKTAIPGDMSYIQPQPSIPMQQEQAHKIVQQQNQSVSRQSSTPNMMSQSSSTLPSAGAAQLAPMPKLELPKYQTINYDMPERKLPNLTFWSSKRKNTDTLLYEQIIQRDKANKFDLARENNGCEPFSIYGFSNKEYLGKLWHTLKYYQELKSTRMKSITNTSQNIPSASIWSNGYSGYGNGTNNTVTQVIPEVYVDGRPHVHQNKLQLYKQAMSETDEDLVPIRLEFDNERDRFFLRDTLVWNKNDSLVKIEDFVDDMMRDYRYVAEFRDQFAESVAHSMREQIAEYQPNPYRELNQERTGGDDMRINIKLDIVVGHNQLIDQFEWDISNIDNCPEEFSESMCQELSLPGEFATAISHSIREQVHMYHKSLALLGYNFDGSLVEDDDIRSRLLPLITVDDVYRAPSDAKVYTPNLLQISAAELERLDKDKDRDTRRKRRQGRSSRRGVILANTTSVNTLNTNGSSITGNGTSITANSSSVSVPAEVALPDIADIPRTFRSPVPSTTQPGGVDLGPSVGSYQSHTTIEHVSRPSKPVDSVSTCHVVDHVPGKFLLVSINLKKSYVSKPLQNDGTPAIKNESSLEASQATSNVPSSFSQLPVSGEGATATNQ